MQTSKQKSDLLRGRQTGEKGRHENGEQFGDFCSGPDEGWGLELEWWQGRRRWTGILETYFIEGKNMARWWMQKVRCGRPKGSLAVSGMSNWVDGGVITQDVKHGRKSRFRREDQRFSFWQVKCEMPVGYQVGMSKREGRHMVLELRRVCVEIQICQNRGYLKPLLLLAVVFFVFF